eukprot:684735-Karenia_brevis.AAC.1
MEEWANKNTIEQHEKLLMLIDEKRNLPNAASSRRAEISKFIKRELERNSRRIRRGRIREILKEFKD